VTSLFSVKRLRLLLVFVGLGYLATGLYQIRPEERAVVRRFGEVVARPGPGLWVGLPYGIDRVDRVQSAKVVRLTVGYRPEASDDSPVGQFLTGDQNLLNLQVALDYSVGDGATDLVDFVTARDRVEGVLSREAEAAMAEWIGGRGVDDVLLTGNSLLPMWIVRRTQERIAPQRIGVRIQQVSVAILSPPDEVKFAFEEVNRAQSMARAQENKARQEANQRTQEAEASVFQIRQQARSYVESKLSLAKSDAENFLKRHEQYVRLRGDNPAIRNAIWWDEMGRVWLNLKARGRVDLLDHHLGGDGLDITTLMPPKRK
jgi:modulator of FtsH protease HflK